MGALRVVSSWFFILSAWVSIVELHASDIQVPDGAEDVVIVFRKGTIDHTFTRDLSKNKYDVQLKFLSQKGIEDFGTLTLTYDPQNENISGIKGSVKSPGGGKTTISKKDIHKKKVSNEWGEKEIQVNIVFPALEVGSIVEYSYSKSYKGLDKTSYWAFQGTHYTLHSEVKFIPWPYNKWGYNFTNMLATPEVKQARNKMEKSVTLIRKNIPRLVKEEYSLPYNSLREGITFYYFDADFNYDDFWPECGAYLYKTVFKKYLKPCGPSKKIHSTHFDATSDHIIEQIFGYVSENYLPLEVLSKKEREGVDERYLEKLAKADSVKDLFGFKYLDRYQINFVLGSLIQTVLPHAEIELAFYVPWDKNVFNPSLKTFSQFREIMLKVSHGGEVFWLAPAKRFLGANRLPWTAKGTDIMLVGKNGCHKEQIPLDAWQNNVNTVDAQVTWKEDDLVIERTRTLAPHDSYVMRKSLLFFEEEEVKDLLEEAIRKSFGREAVLVSYSVDALQDLNQPLVIKEKFTFPYEFDEAGDRLLFKFPGVDRHRSNPFLAENRKTNIIFPYAYRDTQKVTYHIPEELRLVSLPDSENINQNVFVYRVDYQNIDDHSFSVIVEETLEGNLLSSKAHDFFKRSYQEILMLDRKAAVLIEE